MNWLLCSVQGSSRIDKRILEKRPRKEWCALHEAVPNWWRVVPYSDDSLTISRVFSPRLHFSACYVVENLLQNHLDELADKKMVTFIRALNKVGPEGEDSVLASLRKVVLLPNVGTELVVPHTLTSEATFGEMEELILAPLIAGNSAYDGFSVRANSSITPSLKLDQLTPDTLSAFVERVEALEPAQPLMLNSEVLSTLSDSIVGLLLSLRLISHLCVLADTSTGESISNRIVNEFNEVGVEVPSRADMQRIFHRTIGPIANYEHLSLAELRVEFSTMFLGLLISTLLSHVTKLMPFFSDGVQARFRELAISAECIKTKSQKRRIASLFRGDGYLRSRLIVVPALLKVFMEVDHKTRDWCESYMESASQLVLSGEDGNDDEITDAVFNFFSTMRDTTLIQTADVVSESFDSVLLHRATIIRDALRFHGGLLKWAFVDDVLPDLFLHCIGHTRMDESRVRSLIAPASVWNGPDSIDSVEESMRLCV